MTVQIDNAYLEIAKDFASLYDLMQFVIAGEYVVCIDEYDDEGVQEREHQVVYVVEVSRIKCDERGNQYCYMTPFGGGINADWLDEVEKRTYTTYDEALVDAMSFVKAYDMRRIEVGG